jgi:hypothetical protein
MGAAIAWWVYGEEVYRMLVVVEEDYELLMFVPLLAALGWLVPMPLLRYIVEGDLVLFPWSNHGKAVQQPVDVNSL